MKPNCVAAMAYHPLAIAFLFDESRTHGAGFWIVAKERFAHPAGSLGLQNSSAAELAVVEMRDHEFGGVGRGCADAAGRRGGDIFKILRLELAMFPFVAL